MLACVSQGVLDVHAYFTHNSSATLISIERSSGLFYTLQNQVKTFPLWIYLLSGLSSCCLHSLCFFYIKTRPHGVIACVLCWLPLVQGWFTSNTKLQLCDTKRSPGVHHIPMPEGNSLYFLDLGIQKLYLVLFDLGHI